MRHASTSMPLARIVISFGGDRSDFARHTLTHRREARGPRRRAQRCSGGAREQMRLRYDRMERDDAWELRAAPTARAPTHRGGRNDAHVTGARHRRVHRQAHRQRLERRPGVMRNPNRGARGAEMRRTRIPSTRSSPGVGVMTTTSWRAATSAAARSRKMTLDAADSRMIPVADERDLQLANDWIAITCPTRSNAESTRSICSVGVLGGERHAKPTRRAPERLAERWDA